MNAGSSIGLADLATNILAVVLIAFVLLASQPSGGTTAPESFREMTEAIVDHHPLLPDEMVDQLAARRAGSGEKLLELTDTGVRLIDVAGISHDYAPESLPAITGPIRLMVFSNRHYAALRKALGPVALAELSVPDALKSGDGANWSTGFLDLAARKTDRTEFRLGLGQLLEAGNVKSASSGGGAGISAGAPSSLLERLYSGFRFFLLIALPLAAFGAIVVTERRLSRM